jgi:drug/metabolite transporter (DMT)-like permease
MPMRRVLALAFIWGWSFLFIKVALRAMSPVTVAFGRTLFGLAVVAAVVRLRRLPVPRDRRAWRHFAVMAVAHGAAPFTLIAWSETRITSALASVMNATTPLFTALAVAVGLGERLRPRQVVGLFVGFAGTAVAAGVGSGDLASSSLAGAGAALGMAACYGVGFAYAQRHLVGVPPMVAVFGQLACGALVLVGPASIAIGTRGVDPEWRPLVSVVLLGAFGSGVAYVLNYRTIAESGSTRASLVTYFIPVVAVSAGIVFLDEPFRLSLVVGGGLVVVGIALLQDRLRRLWRAPVTAALLLLFMACQGEGAGACGRVVEEPLDPRSPHHLLPGAEEPPYNSDPPTSGAHRTGALPSGAVDQPLPRPVQVGLLEQGQVLVQYREPADRKAVEVLARGRVVVAPNPGLSAPIVATAWRHKLTCAAPDFDALRDFARDYGGRGPESESATPSTRALASSS